MTAAAAAGGDGGGGAGRPPPEGIVGQAGSRVGMSPARAPSCWAWRPADSSYQVREDHGFEAEAAEGLAAGAGQPADPLARGFKS